MRGLKETTIRDFGGGWDLADSDKSLSARFQPVSDNISRGTDGHFRIRYGTKLFANMRIGIEKSGVAKAISFEFVSGSAKVKVNWTAHGLVSDNHISFSKITGIVFPIDGLDSSDFIGTNHGIVKNDDNSFFIWIRNAPTASSTKNVTVDWKSDTYKQSGLDIFGRYYRERLYVFSANGEICAIDKNANIEIVWNARIASALTLDPWRSCDRVSAEIVRGRLVVVNGAVNDKPLVIDDSNKCNYLIDDATKSNGAIPRADFVIAASQYIILVNTEYGPTKLEIGARNTVMTASRETSPSDAVEVDVGMLTQTVDGTILGASVIRSRVFIGFSDRSLLGTLGIYTDVGNNTKIHEPDFNDNIGEFGAISHHTIVSLGNDLFTLGLNGVNSVELTRASGEFAPRTVSDLIHPALLRHLSRLTEYDRRYRTFALYDSNLRQYMLFMPKYSDVTLTAMDAVTVTTVLQPYSLAYVTIPRHRLDAGDYVDIAGVQDIALIKGSQINGRRKIRHVFDDDTIVIEIDAYAPNINETFGGPNITIKPVNDETPVYVYEYNSPLKIRRWSRYTNWKFNWGTKSQLNSVFFSGNGRIWQSGDLNNPFSADYIGDYDVDWSNNLTIVKGTKVRDLATNNRVFISQRDMTTPASGTFSSIRDANLDDWVEYLGIPIEFELETSWTDFKERSSNKQVEFIRFDTEGRAEFEFSLFVNSDYTNFESLLKTPNRSTLFVGQDAGGYGAGYQGYGGGRNTRQEWLHSMPVHGKLFRLRFSGASLNPLKVMAATMYYHSSSVGT